ncbi:pyocin knob domain-containing protein [Flavobacterium sp. UW10123]|uniref:pyocin knob domain-containing protein n=1 Tax=Flavobacterium sp. UW10123 TaxID=3230800 RepID=UPI0033949FE8
MAIQTLNTIKNWFKTTLKPSQQQFWDTWDSFRHKFDKVPVEDVEGIDELLNTKADKIALNDHIADINAHASLFEPKEDKSQKGIAHGYAPLNNFTKLASQYLDIVNDLVSGGSSSLLSAEQGVLLQNQINNINAILASDNLNLSTFQEVVDAIESIQTSLSTILVNDLTTGGTMKALTAEMGKILNENKENKSQRGVANGYAPLDSFTKISNTYLNIVNDLITGGTDSLLSAEQGKVLKEKIDGINAILSSDNINLDSVQEIVDAIETIQASLNTILVNDLTTGGTTKALSAEMGKTLKSLIDNLSTPAIPTLQEVLKSGNTYTNPHTMAGHMCEVQISDNGFKHSLNNSDGTLVSKFEKLWDRYTHMNRSVSEANPAYYTENLDQHDGQGIILKSEEGSDSGNTISSLVLNRFGVNIFTSKFLASLRADYLTARRIFQFPDKAGTLATTSDFKTINGKSIVGEGDISTSDNNALHKTGNESKEGDLYITGNLSVSQYLGITGNIEITDLDTFPRPPETNIILDKNGDLTAKNFIGRSIASYTGEFYSNVKIGNSTSNENKLEVNGTISTNGIKIAAANTESSDTIFANTPVGSQKTISGNSIQISGATGDYFLETFRYNASDYGMQRITFTSTASAGRFFIRTLTAGAWSAWIEK